MICEQETRSYCQTEQDLPLVRFCLFCNHPLVVESQHNSAVCPGCGTDLQDATFLLSSDMLSEFDFGEDTVVEYLIDPADIEIVEVSQMQVDDKTTPE